MVVSEKSRTSSMNLWDGEISGFARSFMHIRGVKTSLSLCHLFMSDTPVRIHSLSFFKILSYSLSESQLAPLPHQQQFSPQHHRLFSST